MPTPKPGSNTPQASDPPAQVDETLHIEGAEPFPQFKGHGPKIVKALELMAYDGLSVDIAAIKAEVIKHNLVREFNKPHVRKTYNQIVKALRDNAGALAHRRIAVLSQTSKSDHVKLDANKWLAGVDNIAPVKRVEGRFSHTVAFDGFIYDDDEPLDVTPTDTQSHADDV